MCVAPEAIGAVGEGDVPDRLGGRLDVRRLVDAWPAQVEVVQGREVVDRDRVLAWIDVRHLPSGRVRQRDLVRLGGGRRPDGGDQWLGDRATGPHRTGDDQTDGYKRSDEEQADVTHVELGSVGRAVTAGQPFGEVESVKSVNDLYAPVSGEIVAVNEKLAGNPSLVTNDPLAAGWMVKIKVKPGTTLDHLMTLDAYEKQIASEGH